MRFLLPFISWLALACGDPFPEPPDTDVLELAYSAPTASIGRDDAALVGDLVGFVTVVNERLGRDTTLSDASLEALPTDPETGESDPSFFDAGGRGFARITFICPGWSLDGPRSRETTGAIETTVRFDSDGFEGVFWGEADSCQLSIADRRVFVDAELILVRFGDGAIVSLNGAIEIDDEPLIDGQLDYAISASGLDYRRELEDRGHVLIHIDLDGIIQVRAANGNFTCDPSTCEPVVDGNSSARGLR